MVVALLGFTSFFLTLAALPLWAVRGGVSDGAAGTVTTVMLLSTVGTQLFLPRLLTRWGTVPTFAAGLLALGAPAPLLAVSHGLAPLLVLSAVRGAGFAVLTVLGSLLTTTVAPPHRHGESIGLYGLAIAGPNLLGPPAGVALTQDGSFGWVAVLAAAPVLAVPFAVALGRHAPAQPPPATGPSGSRAGSLRAVAAPSALLFAATLTAGGLVTFLPIALPEGSTATVALLVLGLGSALSRWRAGAISDRTGSRLLLPGAVVAGAVGVLAVAGGLRSGAAGAVVAGAVLFGTGYGVLLNLTLVIAFARAGPARSTSASAAWNAAFDAGTAVGAGALGALTAAGLSLAAALVLTALVMLGTTPLALRSGRRRADPAVG
jgi:predicted MFS family arabinose efflux permease